MSGIDRVLAGIVLVCAVGGAASFARHSGSDSPALAVSLSTPPLQHIAAPGSVLYAHTPAPTRVVLEVRHRSPIRPQAPEPQRVASRPPHQPAPTPAPAPKPPLSPQEPPRALAAVPLAPAEPAAVAKAHGRALGHARQHGHGRPEVDDSLEPAPATADLAPVPSHGGQAKGRATPDGD